MIDTFLTLLFLHFLLDFSLQGEWVAIFKLKNDWVMLVHSYIWAFPIYWYLHSVGTGNHETLLFLAAGHYLIDRITPKLRTDINKRLIIDQLLHIGQLVIAQHFI